MKNTDNLDRRSSFGISRRTIQGAARRRARMRLMEKFLVLDFKEIHLIGIQCDRCKVTTLVDISEQGAKAPIACCCGNVFYRDLDGGGSPFERLVKALRDISSERFPSRVTAHIPCAPIDL